MLVTVPVGEEKKKRGEKRKKKRKGKKKEKIDKLSIFLEIVIHNLH
jgi:hypothetical protein